jgi:hypothetical protein
MERIVVVAATVGTVVVLGVVLAAVVIVSVASWREDAARSMSRRPSGRVTRAARMLLAADQGFVFELPARLRAPVVVLLRVQPTDDGGAPKHEVELVRARTSLPAGRRGAPAGDPPAPAPEERAKKADRPADDAAPPVVLVSVDGAVSGPRSPSRRASRPTGKKRKRHRARRPRVNSRGSRRLNPRWED